jgi:hypothetical protein
MTKRELAKLMRRFEKWFNNIGSQRENDAFIYYLESRPMEGNDLFIEAFSFRAFVAGYDVGMKEAGE